VAAKRGQPLAGPVRPLPARSVPELIHFWARTGPQRPALTGPAGTTTFGELWSQATGTALLLAEAGVEPGDTVAVWAARTPGTVVAALAVMLCGAAYVPIEPSHPDGRCQAVIDAATPRLLLADPRSPVEPPAGLAVARAALAETPARGGGARRPFPRAGDLAYVVFTSGSTGEPKGVMIEHRSLVNYVSWCADVVGPAGYGTPLIASLGFDLALTSLWPQLARGGPVLVCGGVWDQKVIFGWQREPFSYAKVTPSMMRFFERTARPDYTAFAELLIIGGEILEPQFARDIADRAAGVRLINHYGPAEATIGCCYHEFTSRSIPSLPSIPIGRPVWNTRAYVAGESLEPVGAGQPGELVIAGPGVARGYLNGDPGGAFVDEADLGGQPGRAYRTGDYVELLASGALLFLGRRDDQFKVSGHRVTLAELRRVALRAAGAADVAFHVVTGGQERLAAFVVPADPGAAPGLAARVRVELGALFPAAVVPTRVDVVPEIVMSPNGKCDAWATARLAEGGGSPPGGTAPRHPPASAADPPPARPDV
jgi:amino acid adenylation domain-containing protein